MASSHKSLWQRKEWSSPETLGQQHTSTPRGRAVFLGGIGWPVATIMRCALPIPTETPKSKANTASGCHASAVEENYQVRIVSQCVVARGGRRVVTLTLGLEHGAKLT